MLSLSGSQSAPTSAQKPQLSTQNWQTAVVAGFHALFIITPFVFTWVNEELFEFNKMLVVYALTVIIVGSWIFRQVWQRQVIWRRTPLDIPVWLFLASQLISTLLSIHPRTSWLGYYTRFHGGLLSTVSYTLLFHAFVSNVETRHLKKLLISLVLAAAGVALYAIPEHFGWSPSCWLISGDPSMGVSCWVQDVQTRVFATFGQPNWLAAYLIMVLPWIAVLAAPQPDRSSHTLKGSWSNAWYGVALILMMALLFTKSRSGVLGLVAGMMAWGAGIVWLWLPKAQTKTSENQKNFQTTLLNSGLAIVVVVTSGLAWGLPFSTTELLNRVGWTAPSPAATPITSTAPIAVTNRLDEGGTDSGEIRKIVWEGARQVWQRYPIFGSGVETFAYSYYLDRPLAHNAVSEWDFLYNKAHNEFLNFLATTGAVGLAAYCLLLAAGGWLSWRTLHQTLTSDTEATFNPQLLGLALMSSLVGLSVSNFFGFSTVMVGMMIWLLPAFVWVAVSPSLKTRVIHTSHPEAWQYLVTIVTSLGLILSLNWVWQVWAADRLYAQGKANLQQGELQSGLELLTGAAKMQPQEALFQDELASVYSSLARELALQQQSTAAAQLAEQSILYSNQALKLNDVHLNFYKTRARVFINLATLNSEFLPYATEALEAAQLRAPTDPKIIFNLGLVAEAEGDVPGAIEHLKQALELKPDYLAALAELAKIYQVTGQTQTAVEMYQRLHQLAPNDETITTQLETLEASRSAQPR